MTLIQRKILYTVFILLFLILTPAISFYAAGYNFNLQSGKVQRTGILIFKTEPKNANLNLGEGRKFNWLYNFFYQDEELKTPIKLRNLLPDEYDINISKDGYFPYDRKIKLNPAETLVFNDILLFKQSYPQNIVSQNIVNSSISPDKKKLALFSDLNLIIFNLETDQQKNIAITPSPLSHGNLDIIWAPSSKKVLLNYGNFPIYNIENDNLELEVADYFSDQITQIKWDDFSDNEIYVQHNNILHKFSLVQQQAKLFINKKITNDFFVKNNNLLSIEKINNENFLNIYRDENLMKSVAIPPANNYTIDKFDNKFIYLKDQRHNILHLINPWSVLPLQDSINNVGEFKIIGDKILYWNDFEIWLYDVNSKNKTLITRISEKINTALWYANGNHIIYNTINGFYVIELENNNYLNLIKILDWQEAGDLVLSTNNENLFFVSWFDKNRILYKMNIQ